MSPDEELLQELMASFREELAERLAAVNAGLLTLEKEPEVGQRERLLEELFRHVHSLKGAARAVDLASIEALAHGIEDVFGAVRLGLVSLTPELFDLLYRGVDLIEAAMASVDAGQEVDPALDLSGYLTRLSAAWRGEMSSPEPSLTPDKPSSREPPAPSGEPGPKPWRGETIRVPTARLDDLMAQTGELLVARLQAAQRVEEAKRFYAFANRWKRDWQRMRSQAFKLFQEADDGEQVAAFLERNEDNLRRLSRWLNQYVRQVSDDLGRLSLVTDDLQEGVRQVRMLPLSNLVAMFERAVRDLAREKGVQVRLETRGVDTEVDKRILELMQDPLMHLLRNAIDHGIEPPQEREKLGKPPEGTITLSAERRGSTILIQVADDGAGVDTPGVRQVLVQRGVVSAAVAAEMSPAQINDLIFSSGLSTVPTVTQVSGRGIGLDVVSKNIERLQGQVQVRSRPGQGTTFSLTLPLTLVSTDCFLLQVAGQTFAVPLSAVERLIAVAPDDVASLAGGEAIRYGGRPISLVRLADVLQLADRGRPLSGEEGLPAVILEAAGLRMAFLVDELVGEQEVVVKGLGKQLARVPNVAGATVLGTGQVVLILNVADLIKSAQRLGGRSLRLAQESGQPPPRRQQILVVDDSITTRTLEKNILTAAGYEVRLATDGQQALAALAEEVCDLVVADVDMPRLDGFQLTERLKEDERYGDIPVILVTSLESPEQKARGIAVGADAYIIKSTFDQDDLLDTIQLLI